MFIPHGISADKKKGHNMAEEHLLSAHKDVSKNWRGKEQSNIWLFLKIIFPFSFLSSPFFVWV